MLKRRTWICVAAVLCAMFAAGVANAQITVTGLTGQIKIVIDGSETVIAAGQDLPPIPDGATIVILSGTAEIQVSDGSFVNVVAGNCTAYLDGDDQITASFDPENGEAIINAENGNVIVSKIGGETFNLDPSTPELVDTIDKIEGQVEKEEEASDISPSE